MNWFWEQGQTMTSLSNEITLTGNTAKAETTDRSTICQGSVHGFWFCRWGGVVGTISGIFGVYKKGGRTRFE